MKPLLFLLGALAFVAMAADPNEQAVRAAIEQFNNAAHGGNQAVLEKLLSPDLVYVHSSAKVENKAECIAALVKGKPHFMMDPAMKVHVYGNTATVTGKMTAHVMQNGKPNEIPLDYLQVWVKTGSAWQMVARHTVRVPAS